MRVKFKEMGYRVFIAADPSRALDRFSMYPFDALVLDAGATGEEGRYTFERILKEAERQNLPCAGILILSEDQADWADEVPAGPNVALLVRPLSLKRLCHTLHELLPVAAPESEEVGQVGAE